jgi:hypothetical protein
MTVVASEFSPIQVEKTIDGKACNVKFFGGQFYIGNIPGDLRDGMYDKIVFKPSEFKGAYQPREIISAHIQSTPSVDDNSPKEATTSSKSK